MRLADPEQLEHVGLTLYERKALMALMLCSVADARRGTTPDRTNDAQRQQARVAAFCDLRELLTEKPDEFLRRDSASRNTSGSRAEGEYLSS